MGRAIWLAVGVQIVLGGTLIRVQGQEETPPPPVPAPALAPAGGEGAPPPPPREGERGQDENARPEPGDRRGPGGPGGPGGFGGPGGPGGYGGPKGPKGSGGGDRDRDRGDLFKGLSDPERQRVRDAFSKAWKDPKVTEAREQLSKANDDYRKTLHAALEAADPGVSKILERGRPSGFMGGDRDRDRPRGPKGPPDVNDPDFPRKAEGHLGMELEMQARAERKEAPGRWLHEKLMNKPEVQEALNKLREAPQEGRGEAWKSLREVYGAAAKEEIAKLREGGGGPWQGHRGGPPSGEGPGPEAVPEKK